MRFIIILLILILKVLADDEDDCDMEFDMAFCSYKGI